MDILPHALDIVLVLIVGFGEPFVGSEQAVQLFHVFGFVYRVTIAVESNSSAPCTDVIRVGFGFVLHGPHRVSGEKTRGDAAIEFHHRAAAVSTDAVIEGRDITVDGVGTIPLGPTLYVESRGALLLVV